MCDRISGELLLSFHHTDKAGLMLIDDIINGQIPHVKVEESLDSRLAQIGLPIRKDIDILFYKLRVPAGEEEWKINYIQFFYKHKVFEAISHNQMPKEVLESSNLHLQVVPHSILRVNSIELPSEAIKLTEIHNVYKRMLGYYQGYETTYRKKILILDTGISPTTNCTIISQKNFVNYSNPDLAMDDNGHGTVITMIINELCPSADFIIYKVADKDGRASEWDILAALAASNNNPELVNISLAFGLPDTHCPVCGRESRSSRSAVFENMFIQLSESANQPIIVAAAGNNKQNELSFPARFGNVLAIESIDQEGNLSEFSNRSTLNAEGDIHQNVFVAPGGQKNKNNKTTEYVAASNNGTKYYGTSFSAAYATGIISSIWSQDSHINKNSIQMITHLKTNANKNIISNYNPSIFGNGMICLS